MERTFKKVINKIKLIEDIIFVFSFIQENALDREIVHAMTWLPIKMFTTSVMEGAVDCWCWAIIGRPELELLVSANLPDFIFDDELLDFF